MVLARRKDGGVRWWIAVMDHQGKCCTVDEEGLKEEMVVADSNRQDGNKRVGEKRNQVSGFVEAQKDDILCSKRFEMLPSTGTNGWSGSEDGR